MSGFGVGIGKRSKNFLGGRCLKSEIGRLWQCLFDIGAILRRRTVAADEVRPAFNSLQTRLRFFLERLFIFCDRPEVLGTKKVIVSQKARPEFCYFIVAQSDRVDGDTTRL